ncbi:MAG: hypothetical protein COS87_01570 [Chloroflexi bacterium CG07_land_8_20_14_0_80_45_17]|nr:MAG: hypothetical protein COX14_04345 [Chloroflexi bacterium CG23_combo_of_CG06-09_8_20_14_all_45_10]PIU56639.1 MAG: hypothetical protein COS87_01570 [Chloroflexi bacterium CG07_land_8_20_14_0_80_45_17]
MEKYELDLDQQMIKELSEEFDPLNFVEGLRSSGPKAIEGASLEKYGRNLARKSIERGEEMPDRIYEVIKEAIGKNR